MRPDDRAGESGLFGPYSARVDALARRLFNIVLVAIVGYPLGVALYLNFLAPDGDSIAVDFVAFWAGGKLALDGRAIEAFHFPALFAEQGLPAGPAVGLFEWFYSAPFHALVTPFGLFPFSVAFMLFTWISIAVFLTGLRPWRAPAAPGSDAALYLTAGSPAICSAVYAGNTSLFWSGCLLIAIRALMQGREARAGLLISLLTLKPQLGLLIPAGLLVGGHWRAIFWAVVGTLALAAAGTAIFGLAHWSAFFDGIAALSAKISVDLVFTQTVTTWYAFVRQTGGGHETGLIVQVAWTAIALAAVFAVWRRPGTGIDYRAAVLFLGTLIAVPRAYQYELVMVAVAAMFLARAGIGRSALGRAWLVLLWLLPVPARLMLGLDSAIYAPPVIGLSFLASVWLALRASDRAAQR